MRPDGVLSRVTDKDGGVASWRGSCPPLKDVGPGYLVRGSSSYADDTQVVALGAATLQETVPSTEEWLWVTG